MIATTLMIPIGILVLGSIPWRWAGFPLFLAILLLGSVLGSAIGLVLGTLVKPNRINIVFALVFTPLLFTGCSQYPWPSLDQLPWFQVVTALNPMTYVSEGMRGRARAGRCPTSRPGSACPCFPLSIAALLAIGVRGFFRRAID